MNDQPTLDTSAAWKQFLLDGTIFTSGQSISGDEYVLAMMKDCVDAVNSLQKISDERYRIVVADLVNQHHTLSLIAFSRGMKDCPVFA